MRGTDMRDRHVLQSVGDREDRSRIKERGTTVKDMHDDSFVTASDSGIIA